MLDAGGAVAFEVEMVVLSREQLGLADDLPVPAIHLLQRESRAIEGIEAPVAVDRPGHGQIGARGRFGLWFRTGVCDCGLALVKRLAGIVFCHDQTPLKGIRRERDILCARAPVQMQHQIVGEVRGEHQRCAFQLKGHVRLQ